jgi:hypothetical protein
MMNLDFDFEYDLESERDRLLEVLDILEDARRRHRLHTNTAASLDRAIAKIGTVLDQVNSLEHREALAMQLSTQ